MTPPIILLLLFLALAIVVSMALAFGHRRRGPRYTALPRTKQSIPMPKWTMPPAARDSGPLILGDDPPKSSK